ncbi:UDP-N-acetylmuramoyl-tripeptide--D-alanyl-D-alanine ligase [Cohnella terricola]|uniref:UDP-N-acetylmuramoyl-tripeptide--D-alanyl-D-alanine ligase n=1 Tax=Cohnella terricola TaxID=1289167 RepID=A0A559JL31_9BACL|nr:UDP-N-acetylmuramoyl-tripeptide--D-alanyl-D-alanine ligase [Cohnella terricola]TVY00580.1 UDP-N-acetylmuramoyl-tripeptide--D-alanyl-D-alanine ligase [Cohnella terricola]
MMQATVREVAEWSGAERIGGLSGDESLRLIGVSTDTRHIRPGQLFVPLRGERFDGHEYIEAAKEAGASAALWDRAIPLPDVGMPLILVEDTLAALQKLAAAYLNKRLTAKVIAITGSNGKTTTKDLISSVLATRYLVHKTEGNYNNHIGLPLTVLGAPVDTEALVLEMGMSGFGEISLLSGMARPDAAVITNIGESHLRQLGSRRNIAKAKLEITEGLKSGGTLVYFGDEPLIGEELPGALAGKEIKLVTFGENADNDWIARNIQVTTDGTRFTVAGDTETTYELPIPGRHNGVNALAAVAIGGLFGLSPDEIGEGLRLAKLTGMRIERSNAKVGAVVLNDAYNASPTSVKAAIDLVGELSGYRRKWVVLGDMLDLGDDELAMHGEIGRYLDNSKADRVYVYGPLSKRTFEEAKPKYADGWVRHFENKIELADALLEDLAPDDLVLVKASRGMKMEDVVTMLQRGGRG